MEPNGHSNTFSMELSELKILLKNPEQLKVVIEELRAKNSIPEETKGFIQLYDNLNGDVKEIKNYLRQTEISLLNSVQRKKHSFSFLKYAASFTFLIAIIFFYYKNSLKSNKHLGEEAISKNLYKDPGIPIFMSKNTKIDWGELMFAIKNESPRKAEKVWLKFEKLASKNDTVLYYGGIVYRNLNDLNKATYFFKENLHTTSIYKENSLYFLAVNAWERGNISHAKKQFIKLKNASNLDIRKAVNHHLIEISK